MTGDAAAWKLLPPRLRLWGPAEDAFHRAADRLGAHISVTAAALPPSESVHALGDAESYAQLLDDALVESDAALLTTASHYLGRFTGSAGYLTQVFNHVRSSTGCLIGSMSHGHFLSALRWKYPNLRAMVGPPVTECIGSATYPDLAAAAATDLVDLWKMGPRSGVITPIQAHLGAQFPHPHDGDALGTPEPLDYVAVRPGRASGRAVATHVTASHLLTSPDLIQIFDGAVLLLEVGHTRWIEIDDMLQRLRVLGVLDAVSALVISQPVQVTEIPLRLSMEEIVQNATASIDCPVATNAFVGSGYPCPSLEVGRQCELDVNDRGVFIKWSL